MLAEDFVGDDYEERKERNRKGGINLERAAI